MSTLTRLALNPARREARKLLGSPQAMHAAVLAGFAPDVRTATKDERVLWRLDRDASHQALLYVLSPAAPDLTHLVEQAGWPTASTWESRDYAPLLHCIEAGQRWAFRLTANPVRHVSETRDERGKVKAHVTAHQQAEWLLVRADGWGFNIPKNGSGGGEVLVRDRHSHSFMRKGHAVSLVVATFDGALEVRDPDLLRASLLAGLGRGKAYGCGLLTLARSHQSQH